MLCRCFGSKAWFKLFPVANKTFLAKEGSHHRPVLVRMLATKDVYRGQFFLTKDF